MKRYRSTSSHVEDLEGGTVIEPLGFVDLGEDALKTDHNKRLIDDGILVEVEEEKRTAKKEDRD